MLRFPLWNPRFAVLTVAMICGMLFIPDTIDSALGHFVQDNQQSQLIIIEDELFSKVDVEQFDEIEISGQIKSLWDEPVRVSLSYTTESIFFNDQWRVLESEPEGVFVIQPHDVAAFRLVIQALSGGTHHLHTTAVIDNPSVELGSDRHVSRGGTVIVTGSPNLSSTSTNKANVKVYVDSRPIIVNVESTADVKNFVVLTTPVNSTEAQLLQERFSFDVGDSLSSVTFSLVDARESTTLTGTTRVEVGKVLKGPYLVFIGNYDNPVDIVDTSTSSTGETIITFNHELISGDEVTVGIFGTEVIPEFPAAIVILVSAMAIVILVGRRQFHRLL